VTGEVPGAGTSANAYLVLCARDGTHSGKLVLDNGGRSLCAGQKDSFSVCVSGELSSLDSVMVGHDNTGPSPGWRLDEVGGVGVVREWTNIVIFTLEIAFGWIYNVAH